MTREGLLRRPQFYAIQELRTALEHENATKEIANRQISVASQWIIISGMQLYREALKAEPLNEFGYLTECSTLTTYLKGGPLYNGEFAGHCLER
jgi:hypothetical protein